MQYVANTEQERKEILSEIGVSKFEDLIRNIPRKALFSPARGHLLQNGLTELEVEAHLEALAEKNRPLGKLVNVDG